MDWSGCELVEVSSTVMPGTAVVMGTTISADAILGELKNSKFEEIAKRYPEVAEETLRVVLTWGVERLGWDTKTLVDWTGCDLVERVPGRYHGAPTIVGTRIPPDIIAQYYWHGSTADEIQEDYPSLSKETILRLIDYVKLREASAA